MDALVSTTWLAERLGDPAVVVLDATWHLPPLKKDARAEYAAAHIPGAVYFDIDVVSETDSDLPHMLPTAASFAEAVGAMGIGNDTQVVVYDGYGLYSAARVWWMFRVFGHDEVALLNGGLPKWRAENCPLSSAVEVPAARRFHADLRPWLVRGLEEMRANLDSREEQVIDARSRERFLGQAPEPRPGVRAGHIPGSRSLPFDRLLLQPDSKELLPADDLAALFDAAGIDRSRPTVCSCGTGVTACVLALGLYLTGQRRAAVYDGSWTEWGGRPDTPVDV